MDFNLAYLRIVRKLLIQFDTVLLHYFLNIRLYGSFLNIDFDSLFQSALQSDGQDCMIFFLSGFDLTVFVCENTYLIICYKYVLLIG